MRVAVSREGGGCWSSFKGQGRLEDVVTGPVRGVPKLLSSPKCLSKMDTNPAVRNPQIIQLEYLLYWLAEYSPENTGGRYSRNIGHV